VYRKDQEYAELRLAEAQVHATLALAAATASLIPRREGKDRTVGEVP
jgi:hypothetical protein